MKLNKQGVRDLGNQNRRRANDHQHILVTTFDETSSNDDYPCQVEECQFCDYRQVTKLY